MNEVMTRLYGEVRDVEFMVMGIGDLAYDRAPIQISQFESDIRIAEQLDLVYLEHGGGGNSYESYTAAWYMGVYHTKLDCWKRGGRGLLITMGDEPLNPYLPREPLMKATGDALQADVETPGLYRMAIEKYDIWHLHVKHTQADRYHDAVARSFGGQLAGARSCADADFIVNPMLFEQERAELAEAFGLSPRLLASERCRATTPWDMMLGQIIEENRGAARHGSCGCGIFETQLRYERTDWALSFGRLAGLDWAAYRAYCRRIAGEYLPARLASLGMSAGEGWKALLDSEGLIEHSWQDLRAMLRHTDLYGDWVALASQWPSLLFEAGQGLALDEFNVADAPHLTPSRTTSYVSACRIAALPGASDVEIRYVNRSYLTRHGAGPLPTECPKAAIDPDIVDRTNVPNIHQLRLRYGRFDGEAVLGRALADLAAARGILPGVRSCAVVTHLNETGGALFGDMALEDFIARFDRALISDCPWDVMATA